MKVSKETARRNREQVVVQAGRLMRERGVDGVGVDALMAAAGLTHGGFYRNFASKEALVIEALRSALAEKAGAGPRNDGDLDGWLADYLSVAHCGSPGSGCAFAALAGDVGRCGGAVRQTFTAGFAAAIGRLSHLFPGTAGGRRRRALATMATLVGAVTLARALNDEEMGRELLTAAYDTLRPEAISRKG